MIGENKIKPFMDLEGDSDYVTHIKRDVPKKNTPDTIAISCSVLLPLIVNPSHPLEKFIKLTERDTLLAHIVKLKNDAKIGQLKELNDTPFENTGEKKTVTQRIPVHSWQNIKAKYDPQNALSNKRLFEIIIEHYPTN